MAGYKNAEIFLAFLILVEFLLFFGLIVAAFAEKKRPPKLSALSSRAYAQAPIPQRPVPPSLTIRAWLINQMTPPGSPWDEGVDDRCCSSPLLG
jgi:hypothetical protein